MKKSAEKFGLVVVGNEILDGRNRDAHFDAVSRILRDRDLALAWALCLPDDRKVLESHLKWAFGLKTPFFCCGGIGSTPDDLTRDCAAKALGVPLKHHPEGVKIIRERFEGGATKHRLLMVKFPRGADLIPNPINRVPGFMIRKGYFVPGFPSMAHPMIRWVLDTLYRPGRAKKAATILLPRTKEADLCYTMEKFVLAHPELNFSSLPAFAKDGPQVKLGISGLPGDVARGLRHLKAALRKDGFSPSP
jgi:molybdopterin-biosynthesis enzyme MoeA-like protein